MFSLQRLFGKGDKFFDLLEASAEEARQSVRSLMDLIRLPREQRDLEEFKARRREGKRITEEITKLLCSSFITPLEREDIETLSYALYRIPKTIEKFVERMLELLPLNLQADLFLQQVELSEKATDTVLRMVRQLRRAPGLEKIQEENDRLHGYEGEADKLILRLLRDLYRDDHEVLQMIVLRDMYELLEKVIDRCRDAGNVIFHVVLKSS
jgi:uncharacterized protein Yka (UPF0111/DUF47 family)